MSRAADRLAHLGRAMQQQGRGVHPDSGEKQMKNANMPIAPIADVDGMPFNEVPQELCTIGLTKREYFAAMAMQGLCNSEHMRDVATEAQLAVAMADALLAELDKEAT